MMINDYKNLTAESSSSRLATLSAEETFMDDMYEHKKIYSITDCDNHNMEYVIEDTSNNPNVPPAARVSRYYVPNDSGLQKQWYIPEITATDFKDCLEADEILLNGENGYYASARKLELYITDSIVRLGT